jgi:hypothetical protein
MPDGFVDCTYTPDARKRFSIKKIWHGKNHYKVKTTKLFNSMNFRDTSILWCHLPHDTARQTSKRCPISCHVLWGIASMPWNCLVAGVLFVRLRQRSTGSDDLRSQDKALPRSRSSLLKSEGRCNHNVTVCHPGASLASCGSCQTAYCSHYEWLVTVVSTEGEVKRYDSYLALTVYPFDVRWLDEMAGYPRFCSSVSSPSHSNETFPRQNIMLGLWICTGFVWRRMGAQWWAVWTRWWTLANINLKFLD